MSASGAITASVRPLHGIPLPGGGWGHTVERAGGPAGRREGDAAARLPSPPPPCPRTWNPPPLQSTHPRTHATTRARARAPARQGGGAAPTRWPLAYKGPVSASAGSHPTSWGGRTGERPPPAESLPIPLNPLTLPPALASQASPPSAPVPCTALVRSHRWPGYARGGGARGPDQLRDMTTPAAHM